MKIKPSTKSHPPVGASRSAHSSGAPRTPLPLVTEKFASLVTIYQPQNPPSRDNIGYQLFPVG